MSARRILRTAAASLVVFGVAVSASVGRYALAHPGISLQQNTASWARNHGFGGFVDQMEAWLHSKPPSTRPADELTLVTDDSEPSLDPSTTLPSIDVTTTTLVNPRPAAITPLIAPALKGEGQWRSLMKVRGETAVWATSLRPLADVGSVVATVALFDQSRLHAALFNGTELPGGGPWNNKDWVHKSARPSLVATFNGGFRFEHNPGGYMTEGVTVNKMKDGYATFAIANDGRATIGIYGKDIVDDGTWKSIRQNLPPLVVDGEIVYRNYKYIDWGKDYGNKIYNYRSAVCLTNDDRMAFIAVGDVNIRMLADTLLVVGCRIGMELDINGTWPQFAVWSGFGTTTRRGHVLDSRMHNPDRYVKTSTKDFFAFFDPSTLAPGAVR